MVVIIAVLRMIRKLNDKNPRKYDTHTTHDNKKILGITEFSKRSWCFLPKSECFIVDLPLSNMSCFKGSKSCRISKAAITNWSFAPEIYEHKDQLANREKTTHISKGN